MPAVIGNMVNVFDSALRGTAVSGIISLGGAKGIRLHLNITAKAGTSPTLDVKVISVDPVSKATQDLALALFAQKTGEGFATLTIYPGITAAGNVTVNNIMPSLIQVVGTVGGTSTPTFTYSLTAEVYN